jgi:hypothetical protein
MDTIDSFKAKALDNMALTIGVLEQEVVKSRSYLDRAQASQPTIPTGLDVDTFR